MLLYHFTPTRNMRSILKRGLDPTFTKSGWQRVFACYGCQGWWAYRHAYSHHRTRPAQMALLGIQDAERWFRPLGFVDGVLTSKEVVPPDALQIVLSGRELAEAAVSYTPFTAQLEEKELAFSW